MVNPDIIIQLMSDLGLGVFQSEFRPRTQVCFRSDFFAATLAFANRQIRQDFLMV